MVLEVVGQKGRLAATGFAEHHDAAGLKAASVHPGNDGSIIVVALAKQPSKWPVNLSVAGVTMWFAASLEG